jgi:hypothetical protein
MGRELQAQFVSPYPVKHDLFQQRINLKNHAKVDFWGYLAAMNGTPLPTFPALQGNNNAVKSGLPATNPF